MSTAANPLVAGDTPTPRSQLDYRNVVVPYLPNFGTPQQEANVIALTNEPGVLAVPCDDEQMAEWMRRNPPATPAAAPTGGDPPSRTTSPPTNDAEVLAWMVSDLARSGLIPADVGAALVPPQSGAAPTGYVLPYWYANAISHPVMCRVRLHTPVPGGGKYSQPAKEAIIATGCSGTDATYPYLNPLHLPSGVSSFAALGERRPGAAPVRWLLVEGEKKSVAGAKYLRRLTVGIGGCDHGCVKDGEGIPQLHPALAAIFHSGDTVEVVFDADMLTNRNVNRAAGTLRRALLRHGVACAFVQLPQAVVAGSGKVGLDDWIVATQRGGAASVAALGAAFDALPRSTGNDGSLHENREGLIHYLGLVRGETGKVIPHESNMEKIILRHERYSHHYYYDVMRRRVYFVEDDGSATQEINDATGTREAAWLQDHCGLHNFKTPLVRDAGLFIIAALPSLHRNPLHEEIEREGWDGVERLETMFIIAFGAADSEYVRAVGRNWLTSAVARAYRPGCKVDTMLVLEGAQGIGKSRALRIIGGEWYSCLRSAVDNKDFLLEAHGCWIGDIDELASFKFGDYEKFKGALSGEIDTIRAPYGRVANDYPRRFVLAGCTNKYDYLRDETGNRRFWPIRCADQDVELDWLRTWRGQLLAEAKARFDQGTDVPEGRWWEMPASTAAEQAARMAADPWEDHVGGFLTMFVQQVPPVLIDGVRYHFIASAMLLTSLGVESRYQGKGESMRLAAIMKNHFPDWERHRYQSTVPINVGGVPMLRVWGYRKPAA